MASFRKPKKNIRRRNVESDEDDKAENFTEPMDVDAIGNGTKKRREKEKLKENDAPTKTSTLLSFADEDEDHGDVFQVKKSSYSKKLERKLERERRKKKKEIYQVDELPVSTKPPLSPSSDEIKLVVKKEEEEIAKANQKIILNGRAALMAGRNDVSSSEEDEGSTRFKFSQSKRDEIMIESGKIPDAATIHAARKRREKARQLNFDFIPVETAPSKPKGGGKGRSRLVREEEDDGSDEERINMGTILESNDLTTRRANYYEHVEPIAEAEAAPEPMETWPMTQPVSSFLPPPPPTNLPVTKDLLPPATITAALKDRLSGLRETHSLHCQDVDRVGSELSQHVAETKRLEAEAPDLAGKFRFYQDMRGYVTDLVECLDEKLPELIKLEEASQKLWSDRAYNFSARRRLDVRDQADEMSQLPKTVPKWSREEEEARARRAAEREGRRARRRRARELRSITATHMDGMSSDDEETELEAGTFLKKLEELKQMAEDLFEDVEADFGTVEGVKQRLERWRDFDMTAYDEAYASLCLPKMLGPLLRLHLITWNPLQADSLELESSPWWGHLMLYGLKAGETMESLKNDPDVLLLPTIVEKAVLPKVSALITTWDPLSYSQTLRLVNFINKYVIDMPGMSSNSGQVVKLLEAVLKRLRQAVDNDVFIPLTFLGGEQKGANTPFFQRQFASAVKLLKNMLSFERLVDVDQLFDIALDGLLNRYLLAALRSCTPCDAIAKANMIISTFPRWWFQSEKKIPKLEMLGRQLKQISTKVQSFDTIEKDSYEMANLLLKTLQLACPNPL